VGQNRKRRPVSVWETVEEHIRWAEGAASSALPPKDRREIRRLCTMLTERNPERPLRVGVFGQFSSGKSTLLNALLGAGLLPSAARVTTSVATRLWPAESDVLTVTLRKVGESLEYGTSAFSTWYVSVIGSSEPSDVRAALREIMRSPQAAKSLDRIDIGLAGAVLGPGVVVIDTPGFDATDAGHQEVTEQVAAEVDLAIVLIPANDPGAMSLSRFLHEVLGDLNDRCVFVLTKFRQVPGEERADLQEHIMSWLAGQGFPQATALRADATDIAVAAQEGRLGTAAGEISADAALTETRDIACQLRSLAADRRQNLIEATLAVLLRRLLDGVAQAVDERRMALEQMRQRLSGVQIVDLGEFLRQWRRGLADEISRSARRSLAQERAASGPTRQMSRARDEAVEKVGSRNDIKAIVGELLAETEAILRDWTDRALRRAVDSSAEDLARQARRLRQTFTAQYADLAALTGADPRPPRFEHSLPPISLPDIDLSDAFEPLRETGRRLQNSAYWKSSGGAAAGAAVGTAIFPGIGTLVGAAAGWAAGSAARTKEKERLRSEAEAMHARSLEAARDAISDSESTLRAVLNNAVRALVARYMASAGPVVEHLTANYRARVARLDADHRQVLGVLAEVRQRHSALAEQGLGGAV
jgi:GTPase SAR1 family protein